MNSRARSQEPALHFRVSFVLKLRAGDETTRYASAARFGHRRNRRDAGVNHRGIDWRHLEDRQGRSNPGGGDREGARIAPRKVAFEEPAEAEILRLSLSDSLRMTIVRD